MAQCNNAEDIKNYSKMVTLKFSAEKVSGQAVIIPTMVVDYSDKAAIELFFCWLNGMLGISVSWTSQNQKQRRK